MARVRIEYIHLAQAGFEDNLSLNTVAMLLQALPPLTVTTVATAGDDRPVAPEAVLLSSVYARLTVLDSEDICVAWGPNPTATLTNALWLSAGSTEVIPLTTGDRLSFITVA